MRSRALKEAQEREASKSPVLSAEDIRRENSSRTGKRAAGRSRKLWGRGESIPQKPLSAYFKFLKHIRSDRALAKDVFGDETETTQQSVLAAGRWRAMTVEERKVSNVIPLGITLLEVINAIAAFPRRSGEREARVRGGAEAVRRGHLGLSRGLC